MSAAHTPGRLMAERIPATFNPKMDGFQLVGATPDGCDLMTVALCTVNDADEANARRLAACWNACEGISTEMLKRDPSADLLLSALHALRQRDELLAALIAVTTTTCGGEDGMDITPINRAFDQARAAIAKATEVTA